MFFFIYIYTNKLEKPVHLSMSCNNWGKRTIAAYNSCQI